MTNAIILILALICAPQTWAQALNPPCLPKQLGSTGSDYLRGEIDGHGWVGWTCTVNGAPRLYGFVWEPSYQVQHPENPGSTPIQLFRSYYSRNVGECNSQGCVSARIAMRSAFEL